MLSPEQLEEYRRMTPSERLSLSLRMLREQWPAFMQGDKERVDRKFDLLNRQNDERNQAAGGTGVLTYPPVCHWLWQC